MNFELVGCLIRLRYKLMWARTRSRGGKIALFAVGYLLLVLALMLFAAGGFGAGMAAVRIGKAELVARVVLTSLYVQAVLSTVLLGFGLNAVFSDNELRRYPLTPSERRLARNLTGILDPFWFLVLALDLGLLMGLYGMGAAPFWAGLAAVLLLLVSNYLLARAVALAIDRLITRSWGTAVLMAVVVALSVLPATLAPMLRRNHALAGRILDALRYSPPFGAAAALTGTLSGLATVSFWVAAFLVLVMALERPSPQRRQAAAEGPLDWSGRYERIGRLFGPENAPLVGYWLRFYARNNRFRAFSVLALPLAGFLTWQLGQARPHASGLFVAAIGTFPMTAFLGTARIAVNLFGYSGGGFRRYFLLPVDPAASLRAGSYASVLLGGASLLAATVLWILLAPVPYNARTLAMLVASGVTSLFLFHGAGLWTTLYGARRGNYHSGIGNDMSLMGNLLTIGAMLSCIFLPQILANREPTLFAPAHWRLWLAPPATALLFYLASLRAAGEQFLGRREHLLAVVEGRA